MKKILVYIAILTGPFIMGQAPTFEVDADTNKLMIGDQFTVTMRASMVKSRPFAWPTLPDSLKGLELVSESPIDTVEKNNTWYIEQKLVMTSFDSGYSAFPPLLFSSDGDEILSAAIPIFVEFPELSEEQDYYDIKPPMEAPRDWRSYLLWGSLIVGVPLLLGSIIFLLARRKREFVEPAEPRLPPYEEAMLQLQKLESEELWQNGELKAYYSRLTEILRVYMELELAVNALESTADEIIDRLKRMGLTDSVREPMTKMLRLSDMVKFAKEKPGPEENKNAIDIVRGFLDETKPIEQTSPNARLSV